ncbi:MAG: hypothetical protein Q7J85_14735 [Bacillota bacterium]|nr:hypothetical protein [Bacillota bacterium]
MIELENLYQKSITPTRDRAALLEKVDLVVGIPFLNGTQEAHKIMETVGKGLTAFYPDLQSVVACSISPYSSLTLEATLPLSPVPEERFLVTRLDKALKGRGWSIRSLLDTASFFSADLVILEPTLMPAAADGVSEGLTSEWINLLYRPVLDGYAGYVLPRFKQSLLANSIADHFIFPLLGSLYNLDLRGCLGAGMALSRELISGYLTDADMWESEVYEFGIDAWLLLRTLELQGKIAEVYLGYKPKVEMPVGLSYVFKQTAKIMFEMIGKNQQQWKQKPQALRTPLVFGSRENFIQQEFPLEQRPYINYFRRGYNRYYDAIWARVFDEELVTQLRKAAASPEKKFDFSADLWNQFVYDSLVAYHYIPELVKEDVISSLAALFEGRLAGFLSEVCIHEGCEQGDPSGEQICPQKAHNQLEHQVDVFVTHKRVFLENWLHHKEALQPFLPTISYWEYIPGVPIMLPHLVKAANGNTAHVAPFYEQILKEYKERFEKFSKEILGLTPEDGTRRNGSALQGLIQQVELDLENLLFPEDYHTARGIQAILDKIFQMTPSPNSFSLKEEVAVRLLKEHPPHNLITLWGFQDTEELLEKYNSLDILALTAWSEESRYISLNSEWFRENLRPEHFEISPVQPLVVNYTSFPALAGMKEAPTLNHLTSRIVVSNMRRGSGGDFPIIRLLTTTMRSIAEAEQFGLVWEQFARSRSKDFGKMVINSIEGHWGVSTFSAHSFFENLLNQKAKERLAILIDCCSEDNPEGMAEASERLHALADVYHLGITLPDGYFLSCSLWSWASYSFKGGKDLPTPLSLMIERRWFNCELFFRCYQQLGGRREDIYTKVVELMGQGREHADLAVLYLDAHPDSKEVLIEQKMEKHLPTAGQLVRSFANPILTPLEENDWENKYVLNCGAIRLQGSVYIFYRAVGDDGISRIGLALSKNGIQIDERLSEPVFAPAHESEKMGCEDPRLIAIEGRVYMLYTAYDGITPQIALASMSIEDMVNRRWQKWHRHGLAFPGFPNKDAVLFPERFQGKLAMYHRIAPSIWVTLSDDFSTPWPRMGHKIVMGSRSGMMWDAVKIGAGAQPLKTRHGWLLIYHGVDYSFCYRLGVFLTSLDDPAELIYRSPNSILEPEQSYEVGVSGQSWVPNVVFTCGAVPARDTDILEDDDEILVYYGGADTIIGVASATVADLIPARFRHRE